MTDKFYFITYQATNKQGSKSVWNQVTNKSPMEFIDHVSEVEQNGSETYHEFVVINTCEITQYQYEFWKDRF